MGMWKDYSASFIKKNRASSISIMAAAFIAALFLSFLCSFFYNAWVSEIEGIVQEEGDWQGRIVGEITKEDIDIINNFSNVEKIVINKELSDKSEVAVNIYFKDIREIFQDMPLIVDRLGLEDEAETYHLTLLSKYLIHDPQAKNPPMLMSFYLVILIIVSFSLILIIHNSFAVSMRARIHQFGIFSSVGATPKQILICLMQEAAVLCFVPVFLGSLFGILCSYGVMKWMNVIAVTLPEARISDFHYHPIIFVVTIITSILTVLFSAWLPARKLSRMTPLEAICNMNELHLKKKKKSHFLSLLFGIEGEMAGNALKAQRKTLRTSTLSLTLSFLGFTIMMCFFVLSEISTNHTYFEKYQDVWDVMATVKNTKIQDFRLTKKLREQDGIKNLTAYQKSEASIAVSEEWLSEELVELGGLKAVAGTSVSDGEGSWKVKAPIVIMDDIGFENYCSQIGIPPKFDGTIMVNRIWDSINTNFRYRKYIPYLKEGRDKVTLQNVKKDGKTIEIPIIAYTQELPVLREEYDDYALVQVMPLSQWKKIAGKTEEDMYIRVLATSGMTLAKAEELEKKLVQMIDREYEVESENRMEEKLANNDVVHFYMLILGGFCVLLAMIGTANVFSYTLGFVTQRKREFAQYMSVGVTPNRIWKMFCIEALVIAGRPLLITFPITVFVMAFMIKASYLNPIEFLEKAPIIPVFVFIITIFIFVALAYYLGGKRIMKNSIIDSLHNENLL